MPNCSECNCKLTQQANKVACVDCSKCFHLKCVNMTKTDLDALNSEKLDWRCQTCASERRRSMRFESSTAAGASATLDDLMKEILSLKQAQKETVKEFNKSSDMIFEKIDDLKEVVEAQRDLLNTYLERTEALEAENRRLRQQLEDTQARVEETEQYSRVNCIEIQGVPNTSSENVLDIVKKVGTAIDFEVTDAMVDNCHRLGKSSKERAAGIIVKFVRRIDKDNFLDKKRQKKDLSTRHLDLGTDQPVYVNESLCPARRKLYAQARQIKQDKHYKYIWPRGGNVGKYCSENLTAIQS